MFYAPFYIKILSGSFRLKACLGKAMGSSCSFVRGLVLGKVQEEAADLAAALGSFGNER